MGTAGDRPAWHVYPSPGASVAPKGRPRSVKTKRTPAVPFGTRGPGTCTIGTNPARPPPPATRAAARAPGRRRPYRISPVSGLDGSAPIRRGIRPAR